MRDLKPYMYMFMLSVNNYILPPPPPASLNKIVICLKNAFCLSQMYV